MAISATRFNANGLAGGPTYKPWYRGRLASAVLMLGVGIQLSCPAHGQGGATVPADSPNSETSLLEIIVTARKRSETVQSIPESIDAFGSQEISDAHITKIDDLGNLVSNLNITTRADNTPDVVHSFRNSRYSPWREMDTKTPPARSISIAWMWGPVASLVGPDDSSSGNRWATKCCPDILHKPLLPPNQNVFLSSL